MSRVVVGPIPVLRRNRHLFWLTVALSIYSLCILLYAKKLGIGSGGAIEIADSCQIARLQDSEKQTLPRAWKGYFETTAWTLYFVLWIPVALALNGTWRPFMNAWVNFIDTGIIGKKDGSKLDIEERKLVMRSLNRLRLIGIVIAALAAAAITWEDTHDVRAWIDTIDPTKRVCEIFESPNRFLRDQPELDWSVAAYIEAHNKRTHYVSSDGRSNNAPFISLSKNAIFNFLAYLQQYAIVVMGFMVLFQVSIHSIAFWFFDRLPGQSKHGFQISLKSDSPFHEFGLEHWNHALNNTYWLLSFAMIVPVLSRINQIHVKADYGQTSLMLWISILVAAPMVLTIIGRQRHLSKVWDKVSQQIRLDRDLRELFHEQRLWPLDKNWVSKSGILISFFLLSYFFGVSLADVI